MSGKFIEFTNPVTGQIINKGSEFYKAMGITHYHYNSILIKGRKRAKESARFFKTYNSQIQADVSFNLRSFANFLRLRNSKHAQLEIIVDGIEDKPFKTAMWVITRANELWVEYQEKIKEQLIKEFKNK